MAAAEIYRYFWIKVSDAGARALSAKAALELQQSFRARSRTTPPQSEEARLLRDQEAMARRYLGGDAVANVTRVVIIGSEGAPSSIDILPTGDCEGSSDSLEVSIAAMPPEYRRETSLDWIRTPVGRAWSAGAAMCRLSYAVAAPAGTQIVAA